MSDHEPDALLKTAQSIAIATHSLCTPEQAAVLLRLCGDARTAQTIASLSNHGIPFKTALSAALGVYLHANKPYAIMPLPEWLDLNMLGD